MRSQPRTGHNHRIRPAPGRRTGRCHTVPLYAFADGSWLVVPTNFGRDHHPAWSTNLLHHPHATLTWRAADSTRSRGAVVQIPVLYSDVAT
ncbi:nitroreductase/quinone reductase family protein [Streptomyces sp. NPDC045470]|uniref:nitroreductase/quinone reductase family protein n=1 Tax=Streptomyces sp. NPDC045470 TaxID=3155469 RepID=UPI0033E3AF4B